MPKDPDNYLNSIHSSTWIISQAYLYQSPLNNLLWRHNEGCNRRGLAVPFIYGRGVLISRIGRRHWMSWDLIAVIRHLLILWEAFYPKICRLHASVHLHWSWKGWVSSPFKPLGRFRTCSAVLVNPDLVGLSIHPQVKNEGLVNLSLLDDRPLQMKSGFLQSSGVSWAVILVHIECILCPRIGYKRVVGIHS